MNPKKNYKLTDEEHHEFWWHCHRNYITIVGIGDFGEAVLYKLIKYHKFESDKNFNTNYVHISKLDYENMQDCEKITDGIVLDTEFVLIIGDIENPLCLKITEKLTNTFKNKFIVGFFVGIDNDFSISGIDAMVQLNGGVEEAFLALRLIPDMCTRLTMVAVDPSEVEQILKLGKNFKFFNVDFEKNKLLPDFDENLHITENTGGCGIFAIYGDDDLHMAWVDTIVNAMSKKNDGVYVFTPIVRPSQHNEVKTVLLYSEKLVTHL